MSKTIEDCDSSYLLFLISWSGCWYLLMAGFGVIILGIGRFDLLLDDWIGGWYFELGGYFCGQGLFILF